MAALGDGHVLVEGPARQMAKRGWEWDAHHTRWFLLCASTVWVILYPILNSKCASSSDSNATSSSRPLSSAPSGRGFTSCAPRALYVDFSLSGRSVLPLCPAVLRLNSAFHSVLPGKRICHILIVPDSSGTRQVPDGITQGSMTVHRKRPGFKQVGYQSLLCYSPAMGNNAAHP